MKKTLLSFITVLLTLFTVLFISRPVPVRAAEPQQNAPITYSLETLSGKYPMEYRVRYQLNGNAGILEIGLTNFDFSRVSVILSVESSQNGQVTIKVKSFEVSNFIVPPLPLRHAEGNITNTVLTPEVPIEQEPLPITVSNIAPMEDIYSISDPTIGIIILIALLILGGGGFFVYQFLIRKKGPALPSFIRTDPYEEALKQLNRLKQTRMNARNFKEIYLGIWETVRRFLERVFDFRAMEMSTSEIVSHFNRSAGKGPSDTALEEIHDIALHLLKNCDRVKYAKFHTSADQTDIILNDSFELVRRTREYFDRLKAAAEEEARAREKNP